MPHNYLFLENNYFAILGFLDLINSTTSALLFLEALEYISALLFLWAFWNPVWYKFEFPVKYKAINSLHIWITVSLHCLLGNWLQILCKCKVELMVIILKLIFCVVQALTWIFSKSWKKNFHNMRIQCWNLFIRFRFWSIKQNAKEKK